MKVLVTCPPMLRAIDQFRPVFESKGLELITPPVVQTLSEDELINLVPTVDGWIIGDDPATKEVFSAGRKGKLKAAVKWGVGVDNVDFAAARALDIPISNTPKMFGGEVADIGVAYLVGLARHTYMIDREVRKGNWIKPAGITISGKTIGLIGLGDIGLAFAKRMSGFDVHTIAYDPFTKMTPAEAKVEEICAFPEKLETADFLVLTCALTKETTHIINENSLSRMKHGVKIINISRGKLIDEEALIRSLQTGQVGSAALDVFESEPLPPGSLLRNFDQCIFGTHNGSNTREAVVRATNQAINLMFEYLNV